MPQTKRQKTDYDRVCNALLEHFGSYPKIAAFLMERTGEYVAAQTVRMWFKDRKIPSYNAFLLASAIKADPLHLMPWLRPFIAAWAEEQLKEKLNVGI